jgi:hypothetical protein
MSSISIERAFEISNFFIFNTRTLFKNFVKKINKTKNPVYKKLKKKLF